MSSSPRALLTRRTILGTAAAGVLACGASGRARAAGAELRVLADPNDIPAALADRFARETGITVLVAPCTTDAQMVAALTAAPDAYDLVMPALSRLAPLIATGLIAPFAENRLRLDQVQRPLAIATQGAAGLGTGGRYIVPLYWGGEAILYNTAEARIRDGLSFADLWTDAYRGRVTLRPSSGLAGLGRAMEAAGQLPFPFAAGYQDEAKMTAIWEALLKVAIPRRQLIGQFWDNEANAEHAFTLNGCMIGQNWDSTARRLNTGSRHYGFALPAEGAFGWLIGICQTKATRVPEAALSWIHWLLDPMINTLYAKGRNANAAAHAVLPAAKANDSNSRRAYLGHPQPASVYSKDAMERLWWWPPEPEWYTLRRLHYEALFRKA